SNSAEPDEAPSRPAAPQLTESVFDLSDEPEPTLPHASRPLPPSRPSRPTSRPDDGPTSPPVLLPVEPKPSRPTVPVDDGAAGPPVLTSSSEPAPPGDLSSAATTVEPMPKPSAPRQRDQVILPRRSAPRPSPSA